MFIVMVLLGIGSLKGVKSNVWEMDACFIKIIWLKHG